MPHVGRQCDRVNLRGNRTPDPWHTSPHSNAISQRQLPLAKGFGQCRHSCYRQTQVMCCRLVVGSATYTPPRKGTRPRVLTLDKLYLDLGKVGHLSNVPPHVGRQCDRVNLRGNRTPDPWHTSPHSNAISQRQLPLAKGFGQCRHSCYRQTQVMCCRLVVGSAT